MATPENIYPIGDQIVITPQGTYPTGFGSELQEKLLIGIVEQVGEDVNKVVIGQYVIFKSDYNILEGSTTWVLTKQKNILLIYTPPISAP